MVQKGSNKARQIKTTRLSGDSINPTGYSLLLPNHWTVEVLFVLDKDILAKSLYESKQVPKLVNTEHIESCVNSRGGQPSKFTKLLDFAHSIQ